MDLLTPTLADLRAQAATVLSDASTGRAFERASERELAAQVSAIAEIGRVLEALLVDATGEVMRRSENRCAMTG